VTAKVDELERTLRERMEELRLLHEQVRALRADLAVKDAYVESLEVQRGLRHPAAPDALNAAGYRVVDRAAAAVRRLPWLLRALRSVARRVRRG
jgi:hypothetical protein